MELEISRRGNSWTRSV